MAKFCGKCGSRLDEATGLCPSCDAGELKKRQKQARRADTTVRHKKKGTFLKLIGLLLAVVILIAGVTVNNLLRSSGLKEAEQSDFDVPDSYEVTPVDADSYFENNSDIVTVIDAQDSDSVLTEAEVYDMLADRGFTEPITTEYSMNGEYYAATGISDSSSAKHPMYQTYYIALSGDIWTIFVIDDAVVANPVSFNMESDLDVQVLISEGPSVTSYDSATNTFYETIPKESEVIVKTVSRIDAGTLDKLTIEVIGEL